MILFRAYQTIEDINGTGINGILTTASAAVPVLPALILGALFIILSFGSYYSIRRSFGNAPLPATFSAAGFVCVIVAFLMSLIPGFITNIIIVPVVVLEIIFVAWLITSKD